MENLLENMIEKQYGYEMSHDHVTGESDEKICRQYGGKYFKKTNTWRFQKSVIDMIQKSMNINKKEYNHSSTQTSTQTSTQKSTQTIKNDDLEEYKFNPPKIFYSIIKEYL